MRFLVLITYTKITDEKHDKSYILCLKFVVDQFPIIEIFYFGLNPNMCFLIPLKIFKILLVTIVRSTIKGSLFIRQGY